MTATGTTITERRGQQQASVAVDDMPARLRRAVFRLSRRLKPTAAAGSLTVTEADVLATVSIRGPIRLSDLAQVAGLNPTMLSRIAAKLEERGLLRRLPDRSDGRACLVEVSGLGRRLQERILSERADVLRREISLLEPADRRALEAAIPALEALAERLLDDRSSRPR